MIAMYVCSSYTWLYSPQACNNNNNNTYNHSYLKIFSLLLDLLKTNKMK